MGLGIAQRDTKTYVGKAFVGAPGTMIPHSTAVVGTYTTKLVFQNSIRDDLGSSIVDVANSRLLIPTGFNECRVSYNLAWGIGTWAADSTYAVNDTVVPTTLNGYEYQATSITTGISASTEPTWPTVEGNTVVDGGVTWTARATVWGVGWRGCRVKNSAGSNYGNTRIPSAGDGATTNIGYVSPWIDISTNSAPNSIAAGGYFEFYPSQTSGYSMLCGADLASSWVQLEVRR